ncbi:hypothetical protein FQR65_LT05057 [Abscondita terminalis]|nr:hypothetical protein FQR65_LT05057 [Abscondita terminalis]
MNEKINKLTSADEERDSENVPPRKDTKQHWFAKLGKDQGKLASPIDINLTYTVPLQLEPLEWQFLDSPPKKIKLTNTGHTLQVSAYWNDQKPIITGGPFASAFEFSQLHFHWGAVDMEGSEHTVDGVKYPLEMHVVFFKSEYKTHQAALKERDGIAVLVYLFKLHAQPNILMDYIVSKLTLISDPLDSVRLNSIPLHFFLNKFEEDYYLYWGSIETSKSIHTISWLICREPIGITCEEMEGIRVMFNLKNEPMLQNFREVRPLGERSVFHVCPSGIKYSSMLPTPKANNEMLSVLETLLAE